MAGVAGPMLAHDPPAARRFLLGLGTGILTGSLLLLGFGLLVGSVLGMIRVSADTRLVAAAAVAAGLAAADLADRTPQLWRQVPQRLVRELPPGVLGLTWGIDLGLLVTTKKTGSLLWLATAGPVLIRPQLLELTIPLSGVVSILAVVYWSIRVKGDVRCLTGRRHTLAKKVRNGSATALIIAAVVLAIGAFRMWS